MPKDCRTIIRTLMLERFIEEDVSLLTPQA